MGVIDAFRLADELTKRSTESANPASGLSVIVEVAIVPALNVTGLGLAESEKSGPTTVTET